MKRFLSSFSRRLPSARLVLPVAMVAVTLLGTSGAPTSDAVGLVVGGASRSSAAPAARVRAIKKKAKKAASVAPKLSPRFLRSATGALRTRINEGAEASQSRSSAQYERSKCGDRLIIAPEVCDDGNATAGDGCDSSCKVETGYQCTKSQPSTCWSTCGDGAVSAKEQCDDGNALPDDGCYADCYVQPGYACSGSPSVCTRK